MRGGLLAEGVSSWNQAWRLQGKTSEKWGVKKREGKFRWLDPTSARAWEVARIRCSGRVSFAIPGDQALRTRTKPGSSAVQLGDREIPLWHGKENVSQHFCLWPYERSLLLHMGTHRELGWCRYIPTYRFTGAFPRRRRAGSFLRREQNGFCFPAQFFAGRIHFLEARTVPPDVTAVLQQAGNEGKEGNPEPGSTRARAAWPCSVTGITASRETRFGR